MKILKVQTHANISLNKYWGKRDEKLFLPTKSSLTISLTELKTTTFIEILEPKQYQDIIYINGKAAVDQHWQKIVDFLNFFRQKYSVNKYFKISTANNFPTAAGLASSSSGFAALALESSKMKCDTISGILQKTCNKRCRYERIHAFEIG